jgi:hypothetical protein
MILKNKKGDLNILEAFIAITLIMVVVFLILEQNNPPKENVSEEVYSNEIGILRTIQINDTYRADILSATLPSNWNDSSFPPRIKAEIEGKKPAYLNCTAKICQINQPCSIGEEIEKDVYMQSIFISANSTFYSPRELRLFCWEID